MPKMKKCDYCGKDINVQYTTCPLCGGMLIDKTKTVDPHCPRCKTSLEIHVVNGEEYDICPSCGGLWLDRDEFKLATRSSNVYKKDDFKETYRHGPITDTVAYIPCVRCGKLMNRKNFAKLSSIIIDECGKHGVWLDAGELKKIQHFIADGGLEKAQDHKIEQTRDELKSLETKVDQTALTHKMIHFWNLKRWLFS
jgi:Zn-finger nucleic acid-binding protein